MRIPRLGARRSQYLKDKSEPRMVVWTPAYQSYYSAGDEAECFVRYAIRMWLRMMIIPVNLRPGIEIS